MQSGDTMVGDLIVGVFWRQDAFEDTYGEIIPTQALESLRDYLGPQAPDWYGTKLDPRFPLPPDKTRPHELTVDLKRS